MLKFTETDKEVIVDELKMLLEVYEDIIMQPKGHSGEKYSVITKIASEPGEPVFKIIITPTSLNGDSNRWACNMSLVLADSKNGLPIEYIKKSTFLVTANTYNSTVNTIADRIIAFTQGTI